MKLAYTQHVQAGNADQHEARADGVPPQQQLLDCEQKLRTMFQSC